MLSQICLFDQAPKVRVSYELELCFMKLFTFLSVGFTQGVICTLSCEVCQPRSCQSCLACPHLPALRQGRHKYIFTYYRSLFSISLRLWICIEKNLSLPLKWHDCVNIFLHRQWILLKKKISCYISWSPLEIHFCALSSIVIEDLLWTTLCLLNFSQKFSLKA